MRPVARRTAAARSRSDGDRGGGERWPEGGSLRPALEDQLGAGAILSALAGCGHSAAMSPEALATAMLFDASRGRLAELVRSCASGRELVEQGFADDITVASDLDASAVTPVLRDGFFTVDR